MNIHRYHVFKLLIVSLMLVDSKYSYLTHAEDVQYSISESLSI